tara:strand:+ start:1025 stop:1468 length:444 start_codon:yes stop_codon:yes gene_type:complete
MKQKFLQEFIKNLKPSAQFALPGAGINAAIGMMTGGPVAALAYGGGDLLLNTPAIAAARVARPGITGTLTFKDKAGKLVTKPDYRPSGLETGVNVAASFASYPFIDYLTDGQFYKDRLVQQQQQYFYPGVTLPPEVLKQIQQERAQT